MVPLRAYALAVVSMLAGGVERLGLFCCYNSSNALA